VRAGFAPVPVLTARYFEEEVIGEPMLDRFADELFATRDAAAVMHTELAHELVSVDGRTRLRLRVPFSDKGDVRLQKVGAELVVSVGRQKRTIILPSALARQRPSGARLEDGALEVSFEDDRARTAPASLH
jgi:arsenite-transporting ATPase